MKGSSLAKMAWRNLWRNRRRTVITLSAIVFGIFLSVIMMAMQDRNWADMIRLAARLGAGHVTYQHPEYLDSPTLSRPVEGTGELRRLAEGNPRVIRVVERITGFNMLSTARDNVGAGFIAVSPEDEDEETLSLLEAVVEGEFFATSHDRGIILGERLASNLDVELGSRIVYTLTDKDGEIVSDLARVTGIIRTGSPSVDGGICLLPIGTLRETIGFAPDEAIQVATFVDESARHRPGGRRPRGRGPGRRRGPAVARAAARPGGVHRHEGGRREGHDADARGARGRRHLQHPLRQRDGAPARVRHHARGRLQPGAALPLGDDGERVARRRRPCWSRPRHHRAVPLSRLDGHRRVGADPGRADGGRRRGHVDHHAGRHLWRERRPHRRLGAGRDHAVGGLSGLEGGARRPGGDDSGGLTGPATEERSP